MFKLALLSLLFITSCIAGQQPYKTFKFKNYLSFGGELSHKRAAKMQKDFVRSFTEKYPIGTEIEDVMNDIKDENSEMLCIHRIGRSYVCTKKYISRCTILLRQKEELRFKVKNQPTHELLKSINIYCKKSENQISDIEYSNNLKNYSLFSVNY